MYQALYRKYRPQNFDDMIGQDVIVKTLKNAVLNNKISHAYLFTGPRGTGKTSAAKILAKIINCQQLNDNQPCEKCVCCTQFNQQQNVDVIEIDAASNNGVDEIRELKNKVNLVPAISKYKVYIIDEVHMLSTSAFNALLKTLEEPPSHVIFILATTDPHKVLPTILSRCQRFDFKKVSEDNIFERLKYIAEKENIKIENNALKEISRLANGGLRDALSILDQVIAFSENDITETDVHEVNGTITQENLKQLIQNITDSKMLEIFSIIDDYDNKGKNFLKLTEEIILFFKNVLLIKKVPNYLEKNQQEIYLEFSSIYTEEKLLDILNELNLTLNNIKLSNNSRLIFELTIIKLINIINLKKIDIVNEPIKQNNFELAEEIKKDDKKEIKKVINIEQENALNELKKIRVDNTLSKFNKKEMTLFKERINTLTSKLLDPDCGEIVSMIMDGELKAASDEYLIFVFKTDNITRVFNQLIPKIEMFINTEYNVNYKVIGVEYDEWEFIKKEFNNKTRVFQYKKENFDLKKLFPEIDEKKDTSSIDSMFQNIVEYN